MLAIGFFIDVFNFQSRDQMELCGLVRVPFLSCALGEEMKMLGTILIIVLILLLIGALPNWGYSRGWGYYPGGGLGIILIIVVILVLIGQV
jgi:Protein of unknown function (DUF3309)